MGPRQGSYFGLEDMVLVPHRYVHIVSFAQGDENNSKLTKSAFRVEESARLVL